MEAPPGLPPALPPDLPPELPPESPPAPPPLPPATVVEPLRFTGNGAEYFRIWIVNLALSILTLGIYSAWAKARRLRWFHGHTQLAGSSFAYHGEPIAILKGRLIAAALLAIYVVAGHIDPLYSIGVLVLLALAAPWLIVRARMFALRMSSWRGVRFDFVPDYAGSYREIGGALLLAILSLGLAFPWFVYRRWRFVITRSQFGAQPFNLGADSGPFFRVGYLTMLVGVLAIYGAGFVLAILMAGAMMASGSRPGPGIEVVLFLLFALVFLPVQLGIGAYYQAGILNAAYGTSSLGPHRIHCRLRAGALFKLYLTNTFGILLTLGLYTPFAQLRMAQMMAGALAIEFDGDPAVLAASDRQQSGALGEEVSDAFDVDVGL